MEKFGRLHFDRAADRKLSVTQIMSFSTGSPERELVEHEIVTQLDKANTSFPVNDYDVKIIVSKPTRSPG